MKPKGFSVAELVVVSAIFVLLFAVSVANYRSAEKTETMRIAGQQLTTDLSWLQTVAITGTSSDHGVGLAYGIVLNKDDNKYILFRDDNSDKQFGKNTDRIMKTVTFSSDFYISELILGDTAVDTITTLFLPPRPILYSNGELSKAVSIKVGRRSGSDKSVLVEVDAVTGRAKQKFVTDNIASNP